MCENNLERILAKVDLDKFILLKERMTCAWSEEDSGQLNMKNEMRKLKSLR